MDGKASATSIPWASFGSRQLLVLDIVRRDEFVGLTWAVAIDHLIEDPLHSSLVVVGCHHATSSMSLSPPRVVSHPRGRGLTHASHRARVDSNPLPTGVGAETCN